jgi:GNAT superfamily N-acetyltransferase
MAAEFAYMAGRIDPPSSIGVLTVADLASDACEVWAIGHPPIACMVLSPRVDVLYFGKLAVAGAHRGKGLASALVDHAETRAQDLGLGWLECQTRIELTANQRTFEAMGFVEVERTTHDGYTRPTSVTYRRPVTDRSTSHA